MRLSAADLSPSFVCLSLFVTTPSTNPQLVVFNSLRIVGELAILERGVNDDGAGINPVNSRNENFGTGGVVGLRVMENL